MNRDLFRVVKNGYDTRTGSGGHPRHGDTKYNIGDILMKLSLRRDQKSGFGKPTFVLVARAEVSDEEKSHISKYKLGKTMLYTNMEDRGQGLLGALSRYAMGIEITVDDLVSGKKVECKEILEMLALEDQVKEACRNFKNVLDAASQFGGEEVLDIA